MDGILEFTIMCARESGRIQAERMDTSFGIRHKGEINLVTDVDIACQARIMELIHEKFPDDDIISEEKDNRYDGTKNRWIIDPLDGTTNYAHGYPFFCTSVAYEQQGVITHGVVYNPVFQEMFYCQRGQGVFFNGRRVVVSRIRDLNKSLLSTGFPYDIREREDNNVDHFLKFLFRAQAVRRDGSAALNLCYVACGRFDGFWELNLNPWDMAAGYLMVEEAGGKVTDFSGEKFDLYRGQVLATNGLVHDDMLKVLQDMKDRCDLKAFMGR